MNALNPASFAVHQSAVVLALDAIRTKPLCYPATHTHDGWALVLEDYDSGDCRRVIHYAVRGDERVSLDWSSWRSYEVEHFAAMVDMGFPNRTAVASTGALSPEDVTYLSVTRNIRDRKSA